MRPRRVVKSVRFSSCTISQLVGSNFVAIINCAPLAEPPKLLAHLLVCISLFVELKMNFNIEPEVSIAIKEGF